MKIVDKYGLALCPYGTPFYELANENSNYRKIASGLQILISKDLYISGDGKPFFHGVMRIIPDIVQDGVWGMVDITKTPQIDGDELMCSDDGDSNDYNNNDRFLVLDSIEFGEIISYLQMYCEAMKRVENENKQDYYVGVANKKLFEPPSCYQVQATSPSEAYEIVRKMVNR